MKQQALGSKAIAIGMRPADGAHTIAWNTLVHHTGTDKWRRKKKKKRNEEELKQITEPSTRKQKHREERRGRNAVVLQPPKCWELILFHVTSEEED